MELFTVKRYTDDNDKTQVKDDHNEAKLLKKLLQKAEKRKRKPKGKAPPEELIAAAETVAPDESTLAVQASESVAKELDDDHEAVGFTDYQVLGAEVSDAKRQKVEMVLPNWLAHPTIIDGDSLRPDENADADADHAGIKQQPYLEKYTRKALKKMKIKRLFPVQRAVIPWILAAHSTPAPFRPRDICVSAPTGSGKTLAFAIPIVQLLVNRVQCKVRALVVLPVAELALQVYKVINALCSNTELEVCLLSKQHSLADEQNKLVEQYKGVYYSKVDIVVTTPGRLVEHLHATKGFCLKALKLLVIDEADRIMDAVFQNWLYHLDAQVRTAADQLLGGGTAPPLSYAELLASYGRQPHKLLFSATLTQDPEKLQNLRLFQPKLFTTVLTSVGAVALDKPEAAASDERSQFVGKYTTPAELTEQYCLTEPRLKPLTLFSLIQQHGWKRFLCFTNSADTASRLAFVLRKLMKCNDMAIAELSANLSAATRRSTLDLFVRGKTQGIICSDALARGIDVANVDIVVSYDVPRHIKTYIHRVGRTARAGRPGTAITMVTPNDQPQFVKMLAEVGKSVRNEINVSTDLETQHADDFKNALFILRKHLEADKSKKIVQKKRNARAAGKVQNEPGQLSLMERLQQNAVAQIVERQRQKAKEELPPKKHLKTLKSKLRPNSQKINAIEK